MLDKLIHKTLKQPYQLKVRLRIGKGKPLLLLHGINSDFSVWADLANYACDSPYEFIAVDLLGFGKSPKPQWKKYDIDDHVEAIVATMKKHNIKPPFTVVGHSMGSLITAELMKRYPELIERTILVSLPLYPDKKDLEKTPFGAPDEKLKEIYFNIYNKISEDKSGTLKLTEQFRSLTDKYGSFDLNDENYRPFRKSLENTIRKQNAFGILLDTKIQTDIFYGRLDPLVVGKYIKYLANNNPVISSHALNTSHDVTPSTSKRIAKFLKMVA